MPTTTTTKPILPQIPHLLKAPAGSKANNTSNNAVIMKKVAALYDNKSHLTETDFQTVTSICSLPRYMNLALFRAIDIEQHDEITLDQFKKGWSLLFDNNNDYEYNKEDLDATIYYILKKLNIYCITPDDFIPVLEDIVSNHPALRFLEGNFVFQERYIHTVICRIFYQANCPRRRMSLGQFRKSGFSDTLKSLNPHVDLYKARNIFSYKQFYVLYSKMWSLDTDRDFRLTANDLNTYNMGALNCLTVERVIKIGRIPTFFLSEQAIEASRGDNSDSASSSTCPPPSLIRSFNYFNFIWFLLSEVDKSTPTAIEYWFRCLDLNGDGVLSEYELYQFWQEQALRQISFGGNRFRFQDLMRQMNDLIRPQTPGQFYLKDLKKDGYSTERFFDTFINLDKFSIHEANQKGSIRRLQDFQFKHSKQEHELLNDVCRQQQRRCRVVHTDAYGLPALCNWDDYTDHEYDRIVEDEAYASETTLEDDINLEQEDIYHFSEYLEAHNPTDDDDEESSIGIFTSSESNFTTITADDFIIDEEKDIVSNKDEIDRGSISSIDSYYTKNNTSDSGSSGGDTCIDTPPLPYTSLSSKKK